MPSTYAVIQRSGDVTDPQTHLLSTQGNRLYFISSGGDDLPALGMGRNTKNFQLEESNSISSSDVKKVAASTPDTNPNRRTTVP